jgi:hypothetical protein
MADRPIGLSTGSFFQKPIEETLPLIPALTISIWNPQPTDSNVYDLRPKYLGTVIVMITTVVGAIIVVTRVVIVSGIIATVMGP